MYFIVHNFSVLIMHSSSVADPECGFRFSIETTFLNLVIIDFELLLPHVS